MEMFHVCQRELTEWHNSNHARVRSNQPPHTHQKWNPKDLALFYFPLVSISTTSALNIYFSPQDLHLAP